MPSLWNPLRMRDVVVCVFAVALASLFLFSSPSHILETGSTSNICKTSESTSNICKTPESATNICKTPESTSNICKTPVSTPNICKTPTCFHGASEIFNQMDPDVNPCEDFHKFVCGNVQKNSYVGYSNLYAIVDETNKQMLGLLKKSIEEGEHIVLKTAKRIFQECILEKPMQDYLHLVLDALNELGGWPLLEGSQWDETKFDWLQTTYKLRKLGFPHSIFFNLGIRANPRNGNNYLLKMKLAKPDRFETEIVTEVAAILRGDRNNIASEIMKMHNFVVDLKKGDGSSQEELSAIGDYQHDEFTVDWLKFINTIVRPVQVSKKHVAVFPQQQEVINRLNLLARTSKRTQANYMMWKVLEEMINQKDPDFLFDLHARYSTKYQFSRIRMCDNRLTTQESNCLNLISSGFVPDPIAIMYARKYVPAIKSEMVKELATNIKEQFLELLNHANWMDVVDQQNAIERVKTMKIMIGAPEDYYDDKILDEMNIGLKEAKDDDLLTLILQMNKGYQTLLYKQIGLSVKKSNCNQPIAGVPSYSHADNIMSISLGFIQNVVFNEKSPQYLNYGSLGTSIGSQFVYLFGKSTTGFPTNCCADTEDENFLSDRTKKAFEAQRNCLEKQAKENLKNVTNNGCLDYIVMRHGLGTKLSYSAYKKWLKGKNTEPMLLGMEDYTPNQLFWISSARLLCQSLEKYRDGFTYYSYDVNMFSHTVSSLGMNNLNFANDFNCAAGTKMNPNHKCNIF